MHLRVAAAFLVFGLVVAFVTSLQLVSPDFLNSSAELSFGRLLPVSTTAIVFGFLGIGAIGLSYHVVTSALARPLWGGRMAQLNLAIAAVGVVVGIVAVAAGQSEGREYLEMPLWADVIVAVSLLGAAFIALRTAAPAAAEETPPAVWFVLGGLVWTALGFVAGNVPGLAGVNSALQNWFFTAAFFLGGLVAIGIGVAYHLVAEVVGADEDGLLTRIGFWSLLFVAGWVGPRFLVHGPAPDWLETIAAVFSIVLLLPVIVILADLTARLRRGWRAATATPAMWFVLAGLAFLAVLPLQNLLHALRSSGAVVQFTAWDAAFEYVVVFGVVGMFVLAGAYHLLPRLSGRRMAQWHLWLTLGGLGLALVAMWSAGLIQGYTWVGGANSGDFRSAGSAFVNSVDPLEGWYGVRAAGVGVLAAAQLLLVAMIAGGRRSAAADAPTFEEETGEEEEEADVWPLPKFALQVAVRGAVALFVVALLVSFVVPAFEQPHRTATLLGEARDFPSDSLEDRGREVYISEGCVYCHSQQVRLAITDVGLGAVSQPGDYAELAPALLGTSRIGPDLMHAGSRAPTDDPAWVADHLRDPSERRPWTIMPSYDYLSDADLAALAQYIAALD